MNEIEVLDPGNVAVSTDSSAIEVIDSSDVALVSISESSLIELTTNDDASLVTVESDDILIFADSQPVEVITVGEQGPPGIQGPPGSGTGLTKVAGTAIGGQRLVIIDGSGQVQYADNQILAHRDLVVGLSTNAASLGGSVIVQLSGEVDEPSWNWTPQAPLFLGTNGLLTQTPPVAPAVFRRIVGIAVDATKIILGLREPVTLA